MREILINKEVYAMCVQCDLILAEVDPEAYNDPDKYRISRRVVYEAAQRHKELAPTHRVLVYDRVENAKRTLPN